MTKLCGSPGLEHAVEEEEKKDPFFGGVVENIDEKSQCLLGSVPESL